MSHIFISYMHDDGDFAHVIKSKVEAAGFQTWMDSELRAGDDWREGIDQAIRDAFALIVVMTPQASASPYVTYEWACAWGAGVRVIPVMLEQTDLHPRLEALQYLDFTDRAARPWDKLFEHVKAIADEYNLSAIRVPRDAPPAVKQAVAGLDSHNPDDRTGAVASLAQIDHPAARDALSGALQHPVQDVRIQAAIELAELKDQRAVLVLLAALRNEDRDVRIRAVKALKSFGEVAVAAELLDAADDWSSAVRRSAVELLGDTGDPAAVPKLVDKLHDEDADVRSRAVDALKKAGPSAVAALVNVVNHPDWRVRVGAARVLGEIGDASVVPALLPLVSEHGKDGGGSRAVRRAAIRALGQIADPSAVQTLVKALHARDVQEVKDDIMAALERIDSPEAREAIEKYEKRWF